MTKKSKLSSKVLAKANKNKFSIQKTSIGKDNPKSLSKSKGDDFENKLLNLQQRFHGKGKKTIGAPTSVPQSTGPISPTISLASPILNLFQNPPSNAISYVQPQVPNSIVLIDRLLENETDEARLRLLPEKQSSDENAFLALQEEEEYEEVLPQTLSLSKPIFQLSKK